MDSQGIIHIKVSEGLSPSSATPRTKPPPKTSAIPVPFAYSPSDDGTDENLLILLHGLGDTHTPFANLGKQLKLPQTATLALRAPERIPYLYEDAFQWYTSFDDLGEMILHPDPSSAITLVSDVIDYLERDCKWPSNRIHLFGFAQGGSVACQFALHRWSQVLLDQRQQDLNKQLRSGSTSDAKGASSTTPAPDAETSAVPNHLASIVSVSGPLLSCPALSVKCSTPVLIAHRLSPEISAPSMLSDLKRSFSRVHDVKYSAARGGMPGSRVEWEPIMKFWSEVLGKRRVDGLYEVMSGV